MWGYTGEFVDSGILVFTGAATKKGPKICPVGRSTGPANYLGVGARIRADLTILRATAPITASQLLLAYATAGGDTEVANDMSITAKGRSLKFFTVGDPTANGNADSDYRLAVAASGAGEVEYLLKLRPFRCPGWEAVSILSDKVLAALDPRVYNTEAGFDSSYETEIRTAKDDVRARLVAAGIDADRLFSDATTTARQLGPNTTDTVGAQVVPELVDAAAARALMHVYRKFDSQGAGSAMFEKSEYWRQRFEEEMSLALRSLPLDLDRDSEMDDTERSVSSVVSLFR